MISKLFWVVFAGIFLRLFLVLSFVPEIQAHLFSPFLEQAVTSPTFDPWQDWLDSGGSTDSFPYGPLMLYYFASWVWVAINLGLAAQLGIACAVFGAELIAWAVVWRRKTKVNSRAIFLLAIAPIILVASYIHGQLDILPAALILIAMLLLRKASWLSSGVFIGLAIAAKFSAILLLPIIAIYLLRNPRFRIAIKPLILGMTPGLVIAFLPLLLPGYRTMVAGTPQVMALFAYSIGLGPDLKLLIAPLLIAAIAVLLWRFKRANLDILFVICAVFLSSLPLLVPSSPGWYLWGVLPLGIVAAGLATRYQTLFILLAGLEGLYAWLTKTTGSFRWEEQSTTSENTVTLGESIQSPAWLMDGIATATLLIGLIVLSRILSAGISQSNRYRLSVAPLSVLVAGDSGTGKDTLCASLSSVFGDNRTAFVLGDDYHSFERGASAWDVRTHLDPAANDLARLTGDSLQLIQGNSVWSRHYDHERGRFTKPRKVSNGDVVAISGLHVVSSAPLRSAVDLSVFLDMDNELRTYLKVERDVRERNQNPEKILESIRQRAADRETYIQPQRSQADLVIALSPATPINFDFESQQQFPVLNISATMSGMDFGGALVRSLVSIAGAQANMEYTSIPGVTTLTISGTDWITEQDIAAVAQDLVHRPEEIFVNNPQWLGGSRGISQLLIVLALLEKRTKLSEVGN